MDSLAGYLIAMAVMFLLFFHGPDDAPSIADSLRVIAEQQASNQCAKGDKHDLPKTR